MVHPFELGVREIAHALRGDPESGNKLPHFKLDGMDDRTLSPIVASNDVTRFPRLLPLGEGCAKGFWLRVK